MLCATCWMHGVFGAQLTIGNTSFHKLFSVSRDPYNITRASGLRMLVEAKDGWRLLTVPSAFEIGLNDCRWIYRLGDRTITVSAVVSSEEPAIHWRVTVEGKRCRFLVFGHLVLGEHEFAHAARIEIDARRKQFTFRPDPERPMGPSNIRKPSITWSPARPSRSNPSAATNFSILTASAAAAPLSRSEPARQTNSCSLLSVQ